MDVFVGVDCQAVFLLSEFKNERADIGVYPYKALRKNRGPLLGVRFIRTIMTYGNIYVAGTF